MKPKPEHFASEADMCAAFIDALDKQSWTAYPETAGFDILLVRKRDGFQIGIEAKLRFSVEVVNQALPAYKWDAVMIGPDCRAVLVPRYATDNLSKICDAIGITVITVGRPSTYRTRDFDPALPTGKGDWSDRNWHEWCPVERHRLPEYVPDVVAGASAPVQLTDWKIRAIRMSILLEERAVTRADFKALGLDPSRWTQHWLVRTDGGYVRGTHCPDFKAQHPANYDQIKADKAKWMPVAGILT